MTNQKQKINSKAPHTPVLLTDVLATVQEIPLNAGLFVDATFGRGGHFQEILKIKPDFTYLGIDCDQEAIDYGEKNFHELIAQNKLRLAKSNFNRIRTVVNDLYGQTQLAGLLLDLGVSSPQLDEGHRGFSFYQDGPLDMRLDHGLELTAADIVNQWSEDSLNEMFRSLGEVRNPYRVTSKIIQLRNEKAFTRTSELSGLIEKTDGWRIKGHHPATQYFMALRLEVNQELQVIEKVLPEAVQLLAPTGRLFVITFHSLEDRIVKTALKKMSDENVGRLVNKKVFQASWDEKKSNPRARSAKLRVFEKGNQRS